jgi:hypothetical protein
VLICLLSPSQFAQQLGSGGSTLFASTNVRTGSRIYTDPTGSYDGYASLVLGTSYAAAEQDVLVPSKEEGADPVPVRHVVVQLASERTTNVTPEQWGKWFSK